MGLCCRNNCSKIPSVQLPLSWLVKRSRESAFGRFFNMWILNNTYFQILCAFALTVAAYLLGLSGGFYFDDEWNILRNQGLQIDSLEVENLWNAAMSGTAGPFGRPLAMLSFAITHIFFGLDPFYFKLVNLGIHLLAGWVIYALTLALCEYLPKIPAPRRNLFAFLVMLFWLLHPINLTTVLYPVQRMAGLSALFCLLGMLFYVKARQCAEHAGAARAAFYALSFLVCWPLALASKENAVLFPGYLFLLELVFLKFQVGSQSGKSPRLVGLYAATVIAPLFLATIYFLVFPDWILNGYDRRDFTIYERLLTQSRALMFYLGQLFFPLNTSLGLFHDDFMISKTISSPWTTLFSVLGIISLLVWSLIKFRQFPVIAFGILFFFAAHSLESSVFALELVHEHRNYIASFSVLFAVAYYLVADGPRTRRIRVLISVCLAIFWGATTTARAAIWGQPVVHSLTEAINHPQSPRANYGIGKQYAIHAGSLEESPQKAEALRLATRYFETSSELRKIYIDGLFGMLMMEGLEGYEMSGLAYQQLLQRLAEEPFANNNYNYLNSLITCLERGKCSINPSKIQSIIEACEENPGFSGKYRNQILERYEKHLL